MSDPGGVAQVSVSWGVGSQSGSTSMSSSGEAYTATIGNFPNTTIPVGTSSLVNLTVTATDQAGNTSTRGGSPVTLNSCGTV